MSELPVMAASKGGYGDSKISASTSAALAPINEDSLPAEQADTELGLVQIAADSAHNWTADMLRVLHKAMTARVHKYYHKKLEDAEAELASLQSGVR